MLPLDQDYAEFILELYRKENYELKDHLEVFGLRTSKGRVNNFDDFIGALYTTQDGLKGAKIWPGTTRPGKDSLLKPVNPLGTAIVVPGRYEHAYEWGMYKNEAALKQVKPIKVFRDNNKDDKWDLSNSSVDVGLFGIHIHRASAWAKVVGPYSAGCQVFQKSKDYDEFFQYVLQAWRAGQSYFTYSLFEI